MIKIKVNLNVYLDKFIHVSTKQYSAFRTNFRRKIYICREIYFRRDVSATFAVMFPQTFAVMSVLQVINF